MIENQLPRSSTSCIVLVGGGVFRRFSAPEASKIANWHSFLTFFFTVTIVTFSNITNRKVLIINGVTGVTESQRIGLAVTVVLHIVTALLQGV